MSNSKSSFDWTIDEGTYWPPRGRPKSPFGPTILETLRICPLRVYFEFSEGYERKLEFVARVGIAFHNTLEALIESAAKHSSLDEFTDWTRQKFLRELEQQEKKRMQRPRERGLPRDENRIYHAIEALIEEARHSSEATGLSTSSSNFSSLSNDPTKKQPIKPKTEDINVKKIHVEVSVESHDKLFKGRIDRVEESNDGSILYDYKLALHDDIPKQYERQLQLYAWLWHEKTNRWPIEAYVVYPITGTTYKVKINEEICKKVVAEYQEIIDQLKETKPDDQLGTPGDTCRFCDFRPWCRSFWHWQTKEPKHIIALERSYLGFEGVIQELLRIEGHWKVLLQWRNCKVCIIVPLERFPHLDRAEKGMHIRALEMKLHGQMMAPRARVMERSELFLVI